MGAGSGTPSTHDDADVMAQFERLGVPREQLLADAALRRQARTAGADVQCLPAHLWPAVELARAMRTQMRAVAGLARVRFIGLDYGPMEGIKRALGLPMRGPAARALLRQLQVLEDEMVLVANAPAHWRS